MADTKWRRTQLDDVIINETPLICINTGQANELLSVSLRCWPSADLLREFFFEKFTKNGFQGILDRSHYPNSI